MKIPKARKLPSGSWCIRVQINGAKHCITRPTEKACIAEAVALKVGIKEAEKKRDVLTVRQAIDEYIGSRESILSPSTVAGYRNIQRLRFQSMMERDIRTITQSQWQRAVNMEARAISGKTLKNSWMFIAAVIYDLTGERVTLRLPQVIPADRPWLTPEQILVFVAAIKGDRVEIPALLALSSLRRSELLNLRWTDIDLDEELIKVAGAAVYDENRQLVRKKQTKNRSSRRIVPMIPPLVEALERAERKDEYIVTGDPNALANRINRICERNGLPQVGFHGLRHSFASLALHVGMKEETAMKIGGWSDYQTMKKIYTHISERDMHQETQNYMNFFTQKKEDENGFNA